MAKSWQDTLIDTLLFREGTDSNTDGEGQPVITTGSVVWGIILRSAIIIVISFFAIDILDLRQYWWFCVIALWFGAAYPGWRQYDKFQARIKEFNDSTLCGTCRNFESSNQLCKILDEHPTRDYIPCDGIDWEPKSTST